MLMRDDPEDAAAIEGTEVVVRHIHIAVIAQHDPNESALSLLERAADRQGLLNTTLKIPLPLVT
jgi:hypothetical protein